MPDVMSSVGLGLGAASLAIQLFDGCVKGYGYFVSATNMPEECKVLKVRLLIEYSRLLDWGGATGLSDAAKHKDYDNRMRVNRALVAAILGEIQSLLRSMGKIGLETISLESYVEGGHTEARGKELLPIEPDNKKAPDLTTAVRKVDRQFDGDDFIDEGVFDDETVELSQVDIDTIVTRFEEVSRSPYISPDQRKYNKGLNHIIRISKGAKSIVTQPKRLKWAAYDKTQMERYLGRLKELTDFLHETVGDNQMKELAKTTQDTWMAMLQLTDSVADLKRLLEAMQENQVNGSNRDDAFSFGGSTLLDQSRASASAQENGFEFKTSFERLTWFSIVASKMLQAPHPANLLLSDPPRYKQEDHSEDGFRTVVEYCGRAAWIEWKEYEEILIPMDQGFTRPGPDPLVQTNLERLVALLKVPNRPKEFCVPNCEGYFMVRGERPRFGLLYMVGEDQGNGVVPCSLWTLLRKKSPSLHDRIQLAQRLAECLAYLHTVNWLHKGIRSSGVLLSPEGTDPFGKIHLSGLEYARPDEAGRTTKPILEDLQWGVYIHPGYLGANRESGYRKTYDIYSLGILLIEIAYWTPADKIFGFDSDSDTPPPYKRTLENLGSVRSRLLCEPETVLNTVREMMGNRYYSAVRACLVGMEAFGLSDRLGPLQSDPAIAALLQQAFLSIVVEGLRGIVV